MKIKKSKINLLRIYLWIFGNNSFRKFNETVLSLSLKSLGVNNGGNLSGEKNALRFLKSKYNIQIIFDVGANKGNYTQILRQYFNGKIYCFEPNPFSFSILKKLENKSNIKTYNFGFGNKKKSSIIYIPKNDSKSEHATIYKEVISSLHKKKSKGILIKLDTIDNFCYKNKINMIDFLKIDVEGYEYNVLIGAKKMIDSGKIKIIQFEFNEMNIINKIFLRDFRKLLKNYTLYRILPYGLMKLDNPKNYFSEIFSMQNIIAIKTNLNINNEK